MYALAADPAPCAPSLVAVRDQGGNLVCLDPATMCGPTMTWTGDVCDCKVGLLPGPPGSGICVQPGGVVEQPSDDRGLGAVGWALALAVVGGLGWAIGGAIAQRGGRLVKKNRPRRARRNGRQSADFELLMRCQDHVRTLEAQIANLEARGRRR